MKTTNKQKKFTSKEVRSINNAYTNDMLSPFKVLNWINANKKAVLSDGRTIADVFKERDIKKLSLDNLFNWCDCYGNKVVCKLVSARMQNVSYYDVIRVSGKWYKVVAARYTISDFFSSLNSVFVAESDKEVLTPDQREIAKVFENYFKQVEKAVTKKLKDEERKNRADLKKLVAALKVVPVYAGCTDSQLEEVAEKMLQEKAA